MSILIKGADMPRNCWDCPLLNIEFCPCKGYSTALEHVTDRHADCPLVPVPPHERLIEAERLKVVFHRNVVSGEVFDQLIDIAPTIIEAEGENNDDRS